MRYFIFVIPVYVFLYLVSFAKYNWNKKNRMAAIGVGLMALASLVMPFFTLS